MKLSAVLSAAEVKVALENYLRTKDVDINNKELSVTFLDAEGDAVDVNEISLEIASTVIGEKVEPPKRRKRGPNKAKQVKAEKTEPVEEKTTEAGVPEEEAEDGEEIQLDSTTPTPSIFGDTDGVETPDNSSMLEKDEEKSTEEVAKVTPTPSIFS